MAVKLFSDGSFSLEIKNRKNPEELVREIIPQISEATGGIVTCCISEYDDPSFSYREFYPFALPVIDAKREYQEAEIGIQKELGELDRNETTYEVYLSAKNIPDYKYRILIFRFGTGGYPVTIVANDDLAKEINKGSLNYVFQCNTMEEFEVIITNILRTNRLRTIIQGIIDSSIRGDYNNSKKEKIYYSELDDQGLADIILCDPITTRGRRALARLGLVSVITPRYFYRKLYVGSRFEKEYVREMTEIFETDEKEFILNKEKYSRVQRVFHEFQRRIQSDIPNQSPLVVMGEAENGKTIEVNRLIYAGYIDNELDMVRNVVSVAFDDGSPNFSLVFHVMYRNPYPENAQWGLCLKLLKTVMTYIEDKKNLCTRIAQCFFEQIRDTQCFTEKHMELMDAIGCYGVGSSDEIGNVFQQMIGFMGGENPPIEYASEAATSLMSILMLLMYCTNPDAKNYVILDNIEVFLHLNQCKVQVLDYDIKKIMSVVSMATHETIEKFNEKVGKAIKVDNLGWKRFKVIMVMRRTSLSLFDDEMSNTPTLQSLSKEKKNIADYTGHFSLSNIWRKKKNLWEKFLREEFVEIDPDSEKKITLADFVMDEGEGIKGISYQRLMSQLVSHGLRRNAIAQSHAILDIYEKLHEEDGSMITYEEFENLQLEGLMKISYEAQFMIRRAFIESHFKWTISDEESRDRWRSLGIGHLKYRHSRTDGEEIVVNRDRVYDVRYVPVLYYDETSISLMRRVMAYLSHTLDDRTRNGIGVGVNMFFPVSLFELLENVITRPNATNEEEIFQHYIPIARVLLSLCNTEFRETKGSQFAILNINDSSVFYECSPEDFATLLAKIHKAGPRASGNNGKYKKVDYGIRLTDAGYAFLSRWQTSFSFMASLYCFTVPTLIFLKNTNKIKYVISRVFNQANELCAKYEEEARAYCRCKEIDDERFYQGRYLFDKDGQIVTFRDQIIQQHQEHLRLYKGYIKGNYQRMGLALEEADEIVHWVDEYIQKYKNWEKKEKSVCF